jgi:hypothetical protein
VLFLEDRIVVVTGIDRAILMLSVVASPFERQHKATSTLRNTDKPNRYIVYLIIEIGEGTHAHSPDPSTARRSVMVLDQNTS